MNQEHAVGDDKHEMNLWVIAGYLIALTIATSSTLILQRFSFWRPGTNMLFVLTVSVCKASLVIGFFMHFKFEKAWKYFLCIPPCLLAIVGVLALLPDVAFPWYQPMNWLR